MDRATVDVYASAGGATSNRFQQLAPERLPLALAGLHRAMEVGGVLDLTTWWQPEPLRDLLVGAGFDIEDMRLIEPSRRRRAAHDGVLARARRARTLPDTVGAGMRLLVCGLNPSLYAADAGVGFARPGNRFWPAARAAGLVSADRDPDHALRHHGVGMTDLVKRATVAADELTTAEYRTGLARIERLVRWLCPGAVCFVGLAGWRAAVDRRAQPGSNRPAWRVCRCT